MRFLGDRFRSHPGIWAIRLWIGVGLVLAACSSSQDEAPPQPSLDSLGLSAEERQRYAAIGFDPLLDALDIAGDDSEAVEVLVERVDHKTIGWSGVVQGVRLVKKGLEKNEYALDVASPGHGGDFFPTTIPVLVAASGDSRVASMSKGDPVVFVGRLEFDGRTRKPWVIDARLIDVSGE